MAEQNKGDNINDVLGQVAYQIKETMDTMYAALQRVAPPDARDLDETLDENAAMLTQSFYRLRRLSTNLEEAGSLDTPALPLTQNGDVIRLCAEVTQRAQIAARMKGVTLEFHSGQESCLIAMDEERIERLVLNLLSNAIKFTPGGGKVTVEVNELIHQVEIRVSDTGCGIEQEMLETLFERYRRGGVPLGKAHGMGLGLPICHKIAQDHNGSLAVISTLGKGTTVSVMLEKRRLTKARMNTPILFDYSGGFNQTLMELSDVLPKEAFTSKMID